MFFLHFFSFCFLFSCDSAGLKLAVLHLLVSRPTSESATSESATSYLDIVSLCRQINLK